MYNFENDGFEYYQNVFQNDSINKVLNFLNLALEEELNNLKFYFNKNTIPELVSEINSIPWNTFNHLPEDLKQRICGHFKLNTRLSDILWEIPKDQNFQAIIKKILKTEKLFMHMPPCARFILPNNSKAAVPPHQDFSYNQHMSDFLTVWVPFVEIDEACGGVKLYQGSQTHKMLDTSKTEDSYWNQEIPVFDYPEISLPMKKGDFLTFGKKLIHASCPNISDKTRISIDFRFFGENSFSKKYYLDLQTNKVASPFL